MKQGFYMELDELRRDAPDANFGFLENVAVSEDLNAFNFLHGFCPDFTAMLSDIYGYEIVAIRHWDEEDVTGKLIHAYCISEHQGETFFIDVRGITNDPVLFFEEFENEVTYYPKDGKLWDLEGPVGVESWPNKDSLFDGDYEGWADDKIREFIFMNASCYSPAAIQKLFESIKVPFQTFDPVRIGSLYHVGTMDISKKSRTSFEGNGLSVSNCPDVWRRITEGFTHGDCFQLSKPDLKLLDYYALTKEEIETIQNWAVEHGYVEPGQVYKSIVWDEEGNELYSLYDSYDKALEESDFEEDRVKAVAGLLPMKKLTEQSLVKVELLNVQDIITSLYAERVLDYDGIYWDEFLDEAAYSAPRGVIFNSKLPSFNVVNNTKEQEKKPALNVRIQSASTRGSAFYSNVKPHEKDFCSER